MLGRVSDIWASVEGNTSGQGIHTKISDLESYLKVLRNKGISEVSGGIDPSRLANP
jgi:hypothetical protein